MFEIFEEDFKKTIIDYLMFQKNINSKQMSSSILESIMYFGNISEDGESINITLKKK